VASEFHGRREEPDGLERDPWLVPAHGQLRRQRRGDRVPHRPVRAPVLGRDESGYFIFGYFLVREEVQHARQRRGRLGRMLGASPRICCRVQRALALVVALLLGLVFKVRLLAAQDPQLDPPGFHAYGQDRAVPPAEPLLTPLLWLPFSHLRHLLMLLERADQVPHPNLGGRDRLIASGILPVRIGRDSVRERASAEHLREQPAQPDNIQPRRQEDHRGAGTEQDEREVPPVGLRYEQGDDCDGEEDHESRPEIGGLLQHRQIRDALCVNTADLSGRHRDVPPVITVPS
jgi:hypothetical protein